jgi:hypothetical protein
MFLKSTPSVIGIAAAAAIALGSPALAQMMIGKQQVSEADMAKVKEYCTSLDSGTASTTNDAKTGNDGNGTGATGGTSTGNGGASASGGTPPGIDLSTITAADCQAAGFGE